MFNTQTNKLLLFSMGWNPVGDVFPGIGKCGQTIQGKQRKIDQLSA